MWTGDTKNSSYHTCPSSHTTSYTVYTHKYPTMSPRKFFSNGGRGHDSGVRKAGEEDEVEKQRKGGCDDSPSTTEYVAVASKGSPTTQVQTTRAGSVRSSSPWREHSPSWVTVPFSWARAKASVRDRETDILEKSQKAAVARGKLGSDMEKRRRRRSEKEAAREAEGGKNEWPEHLKWYYGANIPGYWVV